MLYIFIFFFLYLTVNKRNDDSGDNHGLDIHPFPFLAMSSVDIQGRTQQGIHGLLSPEYPKLDSTTDAEYVSDLASLNMRL